MIARLQKWPWITLLVAVLAIASPYGQDLIRVSFYSGEKLARDLSQLLLYCFAGILIALAALEWLIRWWLRRHAGAKT